MWARFVTGSHIIPGQRHSQPTSTSLGKRVYVCLGVTCQLHFRQNDQDHWHAAVVTRGWNRQSQLWRRKSSCHSCQGSQFSYTKIGNFPDDFIPLNEIHYFDTLIQATFMTIFMLLIEWHHFYTETGKFPDDFMPWMRHAIFFRWIFCIFWVPYEKWIVPLDAACFPWPEKNKNPKSQSINYAKILQWWQYVKRISPVFHSNEWINENVYMAHKKFHTK